jgi:mono/diheme cytochrome c family protein
MARLFPTPLACGPGMTVVGSLSEGWPRTQRRRQQRGVSVLVRVLLCVLVAMGALEAGPLRAEDLDAGKSGARLFATSCSSCHRSPRALTKRTNAWSLASYLRQHYTASSQQANVLTAYLLSVDNGAAREKQKAAAVGPQQSPPREKQKAAAAPPQQSPPREKQKAAAATPQQSFLSWLGLPSDSGRKRPKTTKRVKAVSGQPAAPAPAAPSSAEPSPAAASPAAPAPAAPDELKL